MKSIFITSRNILQTSGELRLIKNRSRVLNSSWDIATDYIVVCDKKKLSNSNEKVDENDSISVCTFDKRNPTSIILAYLASKKKVKAKMKERNYDFVILSGIGTLSYVKIIREIDSKIPIYVDMHAANEELIEYKSKGKINNFIRRILYLYSSYSEKKNIATTDGALVVSEALAQYMKVKYELSNFNFFIVPCSNNNHDYNSVKNNLYRKKYRKKYGLSENDVVFVYSGGTSSWQCIDKAVDVFNNLRSTSNSNLVMLVLSHQLEKIKAIVGKQENIIFDSVKSDEINKVLCIGDYGFLLREDRVTNNVAFPNKFLEYIQSGLTVITTPYVLDIAEYVRKYRVGVIIDINNSVVSNLEEIIFSSPPITDGLDLRISLLEELRFENTLKPFVNHIQLLNTERNRVRVKIGNISNKDANYAKW